MDARKALEAKVASLTAEVAASNANASEAAKEAARNAELRDLARHGIHDDLDAEIARMAYDRFSGEAKPATLAEWVATRPPELTTRIPSLAALESGGLTSPPAPTSASPRAAAGTQPAASESPTDRLKSARKAFMSAMAGGDQSEIDKARKAYVAARS